MEGNPQFEQLPFIAVGDVREGDLIFTARPGRLQSLMELAGDPWRHVGVAAIVDGEMSCCEVAGHTFQFRPMSEVATPPHTAVGVGRFSSDLHGCAASASNWTREMLVEENLYAWDDLILAGILLSIRRRLPAKHLDKAMAAIQEAEALALETPAPEERMSFTCASFAFHAYAQAGALCAPQVHFDPVRTRPARYRDPEAGVPLSFEELLEEAEGEVSEQILKALDSYSLLELSGVELAQAQGRKRVSATSRMDANQLAATLRNLIRIVANVKTKELPTRLVVDERWVSTGDLWRLDELALRARLPISDGYG